MRYPTKNRLKIAVLLALAPATAIGQASSPATPTVETITVTAQKRAESIQDVPLSIVAIPGDILEERNVTSAIELQKVAPAVQIAAGAISAAGVTIRIRGFGTAANTAVDSDVASYVDGAFIPRPGAILGSFLDVGSVEVLSGPQGTLFGRNAAMGAISINTNSPSRKNEFEGKVEAGSYKTFSATAIGNVPLGEEFALRVALKGGTTDGFWKNSYDGKTYGERKDALGRVSLRWDMSSAATWTVRLDSAKVTGDGVNFQTVYSKTATDAQLAALSGFITRAGGTPPNFSDQPSHDVNQVAKNPDIKDKQWGATSDVGWDITPMLTARLINSYRDWDSDQLSPDTIATSLDLLNIRTHFKSKSQSHELQLVSPKGAFLNNKLGFTSGLYFFKEDYSIDTAFNLGAQFCSVVLARAPALIPGCQAAPQAGAGLGFFTQDAKSTAGYFTATWTFVPQLEMDLGVRSTKDEKSATFLSQAPNRTGISAIVTPEGPYDLHFDDKNTSARGSLSWRPSKNTMLFGTYQTGYKSGGFNSGNSSVVIPPANRVFDSEKVKDLEVGIKTIIGGRFLVNATLFDTKLENFQDRSFNGTSFLIRNAGDVHSRGVDFDGQVRIVAPLLFTYGATYLDAKYDSNTNAPGLEGCTGAAGCPRVQDLSGRTIPYAPKWRGNVGLQWDAPRFMGGHKATVALTENFSTSFYTSATLNEGSKVPGYSTTDLRASFFTPDKKWQLDVFGTNLFDRGYYVATVAQVLGAVMGINNGANGATVFRGFLGDPRRFGVRLSYKF